MNSVAPSPPRQRLQRRASAAGQRHAACAPAAKSCRGGRGRSVGSSSSAGRAGQLLAPVVASCASSAAPSSQRALPRPRSRRTGPAAAAAATGSPRAKAA